MYGYDTAQWHDLLVAVAGAAAALTGLLFVAMSINLNQILHTPRLPGRAADTLGGLVALLVVSILVLTPGQSRGLLGSELALIGILMIATVSVRTTKRSRPPGSPLRWVLGPLLLSLSASVPLAISGITLAAGAGGGLYWLVPGLVFGFVGAAVNAWVLLVEILR